ncbi:PIG-L family deacetylase [Paenibacillus sp. RC67]|uniref:PIG-L deacetylase family protein n=1 Tax=Paenibacillus sp. RC67 TaxID=3039392 RepID=UPI0024AE3913|nr:PIG-L family deacetylase [Paenibacillus sp. RC67]
MKQQWLFVYAHPDDESFAAGGTIAKAHHHGYEVSLICATSGCKGKSGTFQFSCREELAKHREEELRKACSFLGVHNLILYRHKDGFLMDLDSDQLARQICETLLELKPQVIISFPPDGVTGHPDHIAISRATEKAVILAEAQYPPGACPQFYYNSIPNYYDHCPDSGPKNRCCITSKIDISPYRTMKGQALQAYQSQVYSVNRAYPGVMQGDYSVIGNFEYYTLARANGQTIEPSTAKDLEHLPTMELGYKL